MTYPFIDLTLARRLERTEARINAAFVESRARLDPAVGARWSDVGGTFAMFDGAGSPLTQTFGLGLFTDTTDEELDAIERFFRDRGADVFHEVSPLADSSLLQRLPPRGYVPIELTSVMFRPIEARSEGEQGVKARLIEPDEANRWARTAARGWSSESEDLAEFMYALGSVSARAESTFCFLAERNGEAIGAGALGIVDDVALLAGASTVPEGRRQGAQRALLETRLRFAHERGCTLAMMCAAPGSASQRNAERQGFRIAYTRMKWMLKTDG